MATRFEARGVSAGLRLYDTCGGEAMRDCLVGVLRNAQLAFLARLPPDIFPNQCVTRQVSA
jgi:hypothetical protein